MYLVADASDSLLVRTTRARIIRLRNDYKDLMKTIENHLHNHFANLDDDAAPQAPISNGHIGLPDAEDDAPDPVFARVNTVAAGSPAETAGLKPSDEIRNFGYVNWSNHDGLKRLGECVQGNEGPNGKSFA
ncbi:26S proteasome non-ATPase regulatory subunit 9 [Geosmithia morbida]|uniref:26S proteasome non-ATPase regulatory subunit 9 n=1 Tax=Geosmithia morbida TaxID=1094350 RepID=A0A9P4YSR9_9HYPO|nr:26S proteasome non-ATPase regulatory subunit 9 [Geosmithia morbida]KAF4122438.1 26S proteasome non-ATPase regulatory subunit 9 [Geosmithia morbida]